MAKFANKLRAWLGSKLKPDDGGVSAELGAEAVAIGDATHTGGKLKLDVEDKGPVTIVKGKASASAEATGTDPYADAGTFAAVDGADFVFTWTKLTTGEGSGSASAASNTRVFALDIEAFDFAGGPITVDLTMERHRKIGPLEIGGSKAVIEAEATASGDATFAVTLTDATAMVGYSQSSGYAHAIVG